MQPAEPRHFYLIRGLIREARHWGVLPDLLRRAFPGAQVSTLDIPGAGDYFRQASPLRVDDMVQRMRADFLQQAGVHEDATLIAISLGGMIAAHWLHAHPQDFRRVVLINTSFGGLSPFYHRLRPGALPAMVRAAFTRASQREAVILRLVSNNPAVFDAGVALWDGIRRERPVSAANTVRQLWAASGFRLPQQRPAVPVLLLASTGDRMVSVECSRAIARAWQAPLLEHGSAGHDLSLDDPDWILAQVRRFLDPAAPYSDLPRADLS